MLRIVPCYPPVVAPTDRDLTAPEVTAALEGPFGLLDFGNKSIAHHNFRHTFGELQDIVPDPVRCLLV